MRKGILFLVILALSIPSISMAAPVGNIAETQGGAGKFSIGVENDRVFNRDLEFKRGKISVTVGGITTSEPIPFPGDSIRDMELESNRIFLKGTFGVHPNIDLFARLGMADAKWEYRYISPGDPDAKLEFDGETGFAWGIGAKAKLFQSPGGFRVMVDGQYAYYKMDGDFEFEGVDFAGQSLAVGGIPITVASYDSETKIQEWQVALYVNQNFGQLSPYGGIRYSDMDVENETNFRGLAFVVPAGVPYSGRIVQEAKADKNFGIFLGTDIFIIQNKLSVNIEGRFLDETAVTSGLNYRF